MTDMTIPAFERELPDDVLMVEGGLPVPDATPEAGTQSLNRRVLFLAAPVIGENLLETILEIIDTLLVASLGAVAIAGVGGALQVMFFIISALSALAIGSSVLVPQAFGGGQIHRAS